MLRIATFNLENLDEDKAGQSGPSFADRAAIIRPMLERLRADIICFQEIHGQERDGQPRRLLALRDLLAPTSYRTHQLISTELADGSQVYDARNLVTAIPADWEVRQTQQINGDLVPNPLFQRMIAGDADPRALSWERPLLWTKVRSPAGLVLDLVNVHYKSKIATRADELMQDRFTWRNAAGWAEGYFVSSMKRVGAALETRVLVDRIFDADPAANILVLGDFNADSHEVPVRAVRGMVESTGNGALAERVLVPLENNVPEPARYTLFHRGQGEMIDHVLASRSLVGAFSHTEIHNEILPDESVAFATDNKFPEPDHAPVVTTFDADLLPV